MPLCKWRFSKVPFSILRHEFNFALWKRECRFKCNPGSEQTFPRDKFSPGYHKTLESTHPSNLVLTPGSTESRECKMNKCKRVMCKQVNYKSRKCPKKQKSWKVFRILIPKNQKCKRMIKKIKIYTSVSKFVVTLRKRYERFYKI